MLRKLLLLIIILLWITACKRKEFQIQNLYGNKILLLGHGGMGEQFKYPVNSYESVEPCLRIGADGTEIDVQMSKDNVLIAFHNESLDDWASCEGKIYQKLWTDIDGCKFSSPYSSQIYIMSLENLLNRLKSPEKYYFSLDCKIPSEVSREYKEHFANAILKIASKFHLAEKLFIEARDKEFLQILKQKAPAFNLFLIVSSPFRLEEVQKEGFTGISTDFQNITEDEVRKAHDLGLFVMLWNISKKKENIEAIEKNPDILQSDKIIHLLKLFGKYKSR